MLVSGRSTPDEGLPAFPAERTTSRDRIREATPVKLLAHSNQVVQGHDGLVPVSSPNQKKPEPEPVTERKEKTVVRHPVPEGKKESMSSTVTHKKGLCKENEKLGWNVVRRINPEVRTGLERHPMVSSKAQTRLTWGVPALDAGRPVNFCIHWHSRESKDA
jgi:hypothetical protein